MGRRKKQVEEIKPQEVINEFTEAAKKIDEKITAETTVEESKKFLEKELKHTTEIEEKLELIIEEQEKEIEHKNFDLDTFLANFL